MLPFNQNVSVNNKLTKTRMRALMESATPQQRFDIAATANLTSSSIEHVCATGEISIFVTTLVSRTLNINPFYLTGETDISDGYTEESIPLFLLDKGYTDADEFCESIEDESHDESASDRVIWCDSTVNKRDKSNDIFGNSLC